MRNRLIPGVIVLIVTAFLTASVLAQAKPAEQDETGFTSEVAFGGTANSLGQVYEVNSSIGYTFSKHFGMDLGLPIYFVNASILTTGATSDSGIGNPWVTSAGSF